MQAEDPCAEKWVGKKRCIDFTFVTPDDWLDVFCAAGAGPGSPVWPWIAAIDSAAQPVLVDDAAASPLDRRRQFGVHAPVEAPPFDFFRIDLPWNSVKTTALCLGGTYAREQTTFPSEQHTAEWIHRCLRPLRISVPEWFLQALRHAEERCLALDYGRVARLSPSMGLCKRDCTDGDTLGDMVHSYFSKLWWFGQKPRAMQSEPSMPFEFPRYRETQWALWACELAERAPWPYRGDAKASSDKAREWLRTYKGKAFHADEVAGDLIL